MNNKVDKRNYYLHFDCTRFLAGKELLKSMPMFFNKVYFCKKYADALWYGETDREFENITVITSDQTIESVRQICRNNFLYINDWDSIKYTANQEDFGFSFIAGNIKFVVMIYSETQTGYIIKGYDSDSGECTTTTIEANKEFFLDQSINSNGEFVRTCDFNPENMDDNNTKRIVAEKKVRPEMAMYDRNGFALSRVSYIIAFIIGIIVAIWLVYMFVRIAHLA